MSEKEIFKPYISARKKVPEFTLRALLLGLVFSLIFAIGNTYLALKTGTTVTASIPAAILSMTILRVFFRKPSILENNIAQTIATVGEGMAAGVAFTIPALIFLGAPPSIFRIFILSALGGILGILFMIPMRRYIIVKEHNVLPFPEGKACAEILKAGEAQNHKAAIMAGWGFITAILYKTATSIFFLWDEIAAWIVPNFKKTEISIDATPALLGVGYIIGPRISALMFAGGAFSWWVIIPLIKTYGLGHVIIPPSTIPIETMTAQEIWSDYVRYIGAGAVAIGGLISLIKVLPMLYKTIHAGFKELFGGFKPQHKIDRTDKDISIAWLILGSMAIIITLWILPIAGMNFFTIVLLVLLGFFFVAVTSITVGLVGSSSNPSSGMTITTLLITCLIFSAIGWTERIYLIAAMSMTCVANVAITMASTTSQDLKTGFLLGATPKSQQLAEIVAIIFPAIVIGFTIYLLNDAYTLGSVRMPAPQATLMALIAKGVITKELPFILVGIGVVFGLLIAIMRLPVLPFAIGLYLPLSLNTAIIFGGIVAYIIEKSKNVEHSKKTGILIASGLIGGDAIMGVVAAILTIFGVVGSSAKSAQPPFISLVMFILLTLFLGGLTYLGDRKPRASK